MEEAVSVHPRPLGGRIRRLARLVALGGIGGVGGREVGGGTGGGGGIGGGRLARAEAEAEARLEASPAEAAEVPYVRLKWAKTLTLQELEKQRVAWIMSHLT
uniref:Uncharacterized protein n=1 Tax=Oryza rufipogon TaxID=4529 RepID=A0A0E0QEU0_ORYRU